MHGIPLPPLGSFKFNLLSESIRRQRTEKVAFARLLTKLVEPLTGMSSGESTLLVAQYAEEVMQFNYNSRYEPVYKKVISARVAQLSEDQRLLRKVDSMTVTDEDMKPYG